MNQAYELYRRQLEDLAARLGKPEETVILEAVRVLWEQEHGAMHRELAEASGVCPWCGERIPIKP